MAPFLVSPSPGTPAAGDGAAAAYGIAVTGTMAVTSVLFFDVARTRWGWSLARAGA